ncbi:MAG: ammonia-forming cytochrome c nitrite reductase subunit c552 [Gemmatimonadota bacterium]|nr:ammonia-forming cytochrome c nitrite reductase subunit c552 [Gemmatimonadota bacterium]
MTDPHDTGHDSAAPRPRHRLSTRWLIAAAIVSALAVVGVAALLLNIFSRQEEARNPFYHVVALSDSVDDPAVWGQNFPLHYDDYRRTVDQVRTRYGGSEALPRTPTEADPRSLVAQSRLEEDSRLREMWAGYAFATDFREERGHAYMLEDQEFTERQRVTPQPGACLHCHASVYLPYLRAGNGDLIKGFEQLNSMPYFEARKRVEHPVACIDCHRPDNMGLRVTRPGFMEGIRMLKARDGVADYDVNRDASRQEMRTYVYGQCHVEYYFKGPEKRLEYPWGKGLTADSILAFHDSTGHKDWTHAVSGAPMLKAQHPEFELYSLGIHARSGVACADCHMPYKRQGAMKISDHHVRSPVLNINRSCQTCHKWAEDELRDRVFVIQDRTFEMRNMAIDAALQLTREIAQQVRSDSVAAATYIGLARDYQRKAQFLADFIEAENSMGFHADQEAARILAKSIDYSRRGQMALRGQNPPPLTNPVHGVVPPSQRTGDGGAQR